MIEGHPTADFNGVYTHDSTHKGWPVLKNASGMYCYRYTPADQWMLDSDFSPDESSFAGGTIVAKDGPLPVGAHTWRVLDGQCRSVERTLTVTLQSAVQ